MSHDEPPDQFLLCVESGGYAASLEVRKIYRSVPDAVAAQRGYVRVVDESGEDYLFSLTYFVTIDLPPSAVRAFAWHRDA